MDDGGQGPGFWAGVTLAVAGVGKATIDFFTSKDKKYLDQLEMAVARIDSLERKSEEKDKEIEDLRDKISELQRKLYLAEVALENSKLLCAVCKARLTPKNEE